MPNTTFPNVRRAWCSWSSLSLTERAIKFLNLQTLTTGEGGTDRFEKEIRDVI